MANPDNRYHGEFTSALARARRILKAAGLPVYKITGRYSPFGGTQKVTPGVNVHRVGCSNTIALTSHLEDSRASHAELRAQALEALRAGGLMFDDRGWLDCVTSEVVTFDRSKSVVIVPNGGK